MIYSFCHRANILVREDNEQAHEACTSDKTIKT